MKAPRILSLLLALPVALFVAGDAAAKTTKISKTAFQAEMRKLWEDHVTWTRLYIVSATANLPETDAAAKRLLQNQQDIGDAIKPFYGEKAGEKLSDLLTDHIKLTTEIVSAAMAGDDAKKKQVGGRLHANGDEIVNFLADANPAWERDEMKKMMRAHLDATTAELAAHLGKDWEKDVAAYDVAHKQILGMADMLSAGIIKQFPKKFR